MARPFEIDWITLLGIALNERGKFSGDPPLAKVRQFNPRLEGNRYELSSFCLDRLVSPECWVHLDRCTNNPAIPARIEISVSHVVAAGLQWEPDWEPERHVNIVGWSAEEIERKAASQRLHRFHQVRLRS